MSHVDGDMPDTSIAIVVNGNISEGDEVYVSMPNGQYHNFAITIHTTDGYVARKSGSMVNVEQSAIATITVSNLSFTSTDVPTLAVRAFWAFHETKPIVFHYNYTQPVGEGATRIDNWHSIPIWREINTNSVDVYTAAPQINAPANCDQMFWHYDGTSIDFGYGFNTSNVTNMYIMFQDCYNLTSLDLSTFNTSNVTNMAAMFYDCYNLTSLDLSSFNTSNVTNMSNMFHDCWSLTSLDLSNFNTSNVTVMKAMFDGDTSLTSLDLSTFNTSNVTTMEYMFGSCKNLTSLDLSSFNTSNVTNMLRMFVGCRDLMSLDLSTFNTSNVTTMQLMFGGCSNLTSLDLSNFNISNVTDMNSMFSYCYRMTSIEFASSATINSSANIASILSGLGEFASGGCTIHCNTAVMNKLMSSSGYNSDYVHFNTVY